MNIGCCFPTAESSTSMRWLPRGGKGAGVARFIGAVTDISDRKAAEEKIREKETELTQMLDFAPQLIAVYGPNRERLYANRVALDYAGLTLEEWRQTKTPGAFTHPD